MVEVIPSGTSDPSQWNKIQADENSAIYKLFLQQEQAKALQGERLAYGTQLQADQQKFQAGQNELTRQHQTQIEDSRQAAYGAGGGSGSLSPDLEAVQPQWREIEKKHGLQEGTLNALAGPESAGGRSRGYNKAGSGAYGIFQFMPGTLAQFPGYTQADLVDPIKSAELTAMLARRNLDYYNSKTGKNTNDVGTVHGLHVQGSAGFTKLDMMPYAPAASAVGLGAVVGNYGTANMTGRQYADTLRAKGIRSHAMWQRRSGANNAAAFTPPSQPNSTQQPTTTAQAIPASGQQQPAATTAATSTTPVAASSTNTIPSPTGTGGKVITAANGKKFEQIATPDGKVRFRPIE